MAVINADTNIGDFAGPKQAQGTVVTAIKGKGSVLDSGGASTPIDPVATIKEVEQAVRTLNENLGREDVRLQFRIDETLKRPVVTVISQDTGEVVHQLPDDKVLHAVKNIESLRGILFDELG